MAVDRLFIELNQVILRSYRNGAESQMTILFTTLLSIVVICSVLYPLMRSRNGDQQPGSVGPDENSIRMAVDGLSSAQLDLAIGNLDRKSYDALEEKYILEAGASDRPDRSQTDNE